MGAWINLFCFGAGGGKQASKYSSCERVILFQRECNAYENLTFRIFGHSLLTFI